MLRFDGGRIQCRDDDVDPSQRLIKTGFRGVIDGYHVGTCRDKFLSAGRVKGVATDQDLDLVSFGQERLDYVVAETG